MYSSQKVKQNWMKEDIISYIESSETIEEAHAILWDITENVENVSELISALKEIMCTDGELDLKHEIKLKKFKIIATNSSLDFILDHYLPMIEATNIDLKNENFISLRINIIHFLCNLLIDFPYNINPYYFYHKAMWNILLKIMKRCNHYIHYSSNPSVTQCHPIVLEAFRSAINLFEKSRNRMSQKVQANRLLSLVINNQNDPLLKSLTINFAMQMHPSEFGFVTVCKQIISNGVSDPTDLKLIHDILHHPNVRYPNDVYKYLFTTAVTHKIYSNSAMYIVENTFPTFSNRLVDFKTWCTLFIKRCSEFITFAFHKKGKQMTKDDQPKTKYCRKVYLIRRFFDKLFNLKIDWLSSVIQKSVYTVISLDEDSYSFLNNHYEISSLEENSNIKIELDDRIKEDIISTNVELLNLKKMLFDIRTSLPMISSLSIKINNQSESSEEKKLTFAEVRSRYLKNKSKLPAKKFAKDSKSKINDDIAILMTLESPNKPFSSNTSENGEKEEKTIDTQYQLISNENNVTEMI